MGARKLNNQLISAKENRKKARGSQRSFGPDFKRRRLLRDTSSFFIYEKTLLHTMSGWKIHRMPSEMLILS
jgi:hypothetical protein